MARLGLRSKSLGKLSISTLTINYTKASFRTKIDKAMVSVCFRILVYTKVAGRMEHFTAVVILCIHKGMSCNQILTTDKLS